MAMGIEGDRTVKGPPGRRRGVASSGVRAAMLWRSEIDRSGGLGKPYFKQCYEGDHVATSAATPHHRTTRWHSLPRDRRGAWVGVAPDRRRVATWLPHYAAAAVTTAERFHATGDEPVGRECHASM